MFRLTEAVIFLLLVHFGSITECSRCTLNDEKSVVYLQQIDTFYSGCRGLVKNSRIICDRIDRRSSEKGRQQTMNSGY